MRLALITQDFPPDTGGIETYSSEISHRFAQWCDYFTVFAPLKKGSGKLDSSLPFPIERRGSRNTLLPLALLSILPDRMYQKNIEASFHAQWQTVFSSLVARKLSGMSLKIFSAAHARELLFNPFKGTILAAPFRQYRSTILHKVDHWYPVSTYTRNLLVDLGIPKERTTIIHNGTDPDRFYPFDASDMRKRMGLEGRKILLTITRLVGRKGIDEVIKAVGRLRAEFPDLAYVVVGKGPEEQQLRQLVNRHQLHSHVFFTGEVPHKKLAHYYNMCDMFVMPSKTVAPDVEGFGIVFLEANACGKPVIGSRSGGIPDAVIDGETGLLVDEKAVDSLTQAIRKLIRQPRRARTMGENGRRRVEKKLNWESVSRKLYENMENKISV